MKTMTYFGTKVLGALSLVALLAGCDTSSPSTMAPSASPRTAAVQAPSLGAAAAFAAFGGGAGITNQGTNTVIHGNIGTTGASTTLTGFHSSTFVYVETPLNVGTVDGLVITDAPQGTPADFTLATTVAADALNASNLLAALPGGIDPGAGLLGGLTLAQGVYKSASGSFLLDGSDLTLDAQGDVDAVWVFQMAGSLTVGNPTAARSVVLANGAQSKNVYWQVGSEATNTGNGTMTIHNTSTAAVTVTNTGSGNVYVTATGGDSLTLTHTGNEDFTYPATTSLAKR